MQKGASNFAIWRIEGTFKEGCFDKGDGSGCIGPIIAQMRVDLGVIDSSRTIVLSWLDGNSTRHTDSLYILAQ